MISDSPIPGAIEVHGSFYVRNAKGNLVPIETVKAEDIERDKLVRELAAEAEAVSKALADFKTKAFATVNLFLELVGEKYGAKARPGGDKGNVTLATYDGLIRLQVQVADLIRFEDAALGACKDLVMECVAEWVEGSKAELRVIVMNAFRQDKAGNLNRGALLGLLSYDIKDPRWIRAMDALRDSITVDGSKAYVRFHKRGAADGPWRAISLDVATA